MTIGIVGLGLIGGSIAKAIKKYTKFNVLVYDVNEDVQDKVMSENQFDGILNCSNIGKCDFLILAIYPKATIEYVTSYLQHMKQGAIVVDCAGVKERICNELSPLCSSRGISFIGGHPMAGATNSGFAYSKAELFANATMILCKDGYTSPDAFDKASELFLSIGFAEINTTTPQQHDSVIAYTSQLAHIVSSAYVKSPTMQSRKGFSAGSFKDLSRVAKLNEYMWSELFFENKANLLTEIDGIINELIKYKEALGNDDLTEMQRLLRRGRMLKEEDISHESAK